MTLLGLLAALKASRWVFYAVSLLVGAGAYEGWKYHQQHVGASKLEAKIEQKADANAQVADSIRDDVAAGKRGVRGKYERPAGQ